jgi:hypothetical protein
LPAVYQKQAGLARPNVELEHSREYRGGRLAISYSGKKDSSLCSE